MKREEVERIRLLHKLGKFLLKYIPFLVAIADVVFCVWRAHGLEKLHVVSSLGSVGFFWMPYILISSYAAGFCAWHRRLLYYDFAVWLMMYLELWVGFGSFRPVLNWFFAVLGIGLILDVLAHIYVKKCKMKLARP